MRTAGANRPMDLFVETGPATPRGSVDWDDEARALLRRVNLEARDPRGDA